MLTAKQVAPMLGISPRAVYDLFHADKLPGYRLGASDGAIRFDLADVEATRKALDRAPLIKARVLREYERLRQRALAVDPDAALPELSATQRAVADKRFRRLRMPPWASSKAIRAVYAEARRLTRTTGVLHHVDHDIPLQGEFVSGLHVETNLKILPWIDNIKKRNRFEAS